MTPRIVHSCESVCVCVCVCVTGCWAAESASVAAAAARRRGDIYPRRRMGRISPSRQKQVWREVGVLPGTIVYHASGLMSSNWPKRLCLTF